jgi:hypothetical protein
VVLQSCTEHEIITITSATEAEAECIILEGKFQHQPDAKFVWQLTKGITTLPRLPIRAVPEPDHQSRRRACGIFLARLVDARQPVFVGNRDQKSA